jgi:hypothetical protein
MADDALWCSTKFRFRFRVRSENALPFSASSVLKRLYRSSMLMKNSDANGFEGAYLQVRRCNSFIFVIPKRL